jgi:predicted DNA-binding transcriptional regulator YafY
MPTPKLQRWIDLLAALLRRNYPVRLEDLVGEVPGYDSGQKSETRRRMFERDKDELRSFGIPIETRDVGDGELGYQLPRKGFYLPYLAVLQEGRATQPERVSRFGYRDIPYLTFEPDELSAVALAARRVAELSIPQLTEEADSAVRKLAHDLPPDALDDADGVVHRHGETDEAVFEALSDGLMRRKRVSFTYRSMERDAEGRRTVEPWGLFFLGHHWYLAAVEPGASQVKNFRLSRIREVEVNPEREKTPDFEIAATFRLSDHASARHNWELGSGDSVEVRVRITSETGAALAAGRLGEPVPGREDLRLFRVRRPEAFCRWLLSSAGAAVPVEPPEVVGVWRDLVARTLALYEVEDGRRQSKTVEDGRLG